MTTTIITISIAAIIIVGLIIFIREKMASAGKRWLGLLRAYPGYSSKEKERYEDVKFHYSGTEDENLKKLRELYCLDAVAGSGLETERIIKLMKWANRLTWHHPRPKLSAPYHALHIIALAHRKNGINCWMFALTLNEVYLSMGLASRLVHLKPYSNENKESHFVVSVYSNELGKWIFMDPDFGGYFMDKAGNLLGITEIRQRLITGEPLLANRDVKGFTAILGKGSYPWYLSKNMFKYACAARSESDQETERMGKTYYELIPDGYNEDVLLKPQLTPRGARIVSINDEELFWQRP